MLNISFGSEEVTETFTTSDDVTLSSIDEEIIIEEIIISLEA